MTAPPDAAPSGLWQGGWYRFARRLPSPNFGARPARREHRPDRGALHQPAARMLRRRRGAAPVHQHAGLERASLLQGHRGAGGVGALLHPAQRRAVAVRQLRRPRLARRAFAVPRPRRVQRRFGGHRARRAGGRPVRGRRSTRRWRTCAPPSRNAIRSRTSPATSTSRRAASATRARASTGRCCSAAWRGRHSVFRPRIRTPTPRLPHKTGASGRAAFPPRRPERQRRARPGRGAMATAFGSAAARLSTEFPALNGLAARAKQLACAALRFKQVLRVRHVRAARFAPAGARERRWAARPSTAGAWASFAPRPGRARRCSDMQARHR